jgi:hypothetical protein
VFVASARKSIKPQLNGIAFVALPTGNRSSAFISKMQKDNELEKECIYPKCVTKFKIKTSTNYQKLMSAN